MTKQCTDEYERPGGRERGDRIVRCHLHAGHPGEHEEDGTEVTWISPDPDTPKGYTEDDVEIEAFVKGAKAGKFDLPEPINASVVLPDPLFDELAEALDRPEEVPDVG